MTIAGADRGLTVDAMADMTIGQIVDYVEEYNRIHGENEESGKRKEKEEVVRRKATQADWDNLFG